MPKKGYKCITLKDYLQKNLADKAKEFNLTIPEYLLLLSRFVANKKLCINHIDGNPKNIDLINLEFWEE